jgi:putative ubiquitin-RnfH superfamily antitoxin RatB of RatAB toxin-antitoxin module
MAIRFDASGDSLIRTTNTPTSTNYTMMGWFQIAVDRNNYTAFLSNGSTGSGSNTLQTDVDGTTLNIWNGFVAGAGTNLTVGTWYHLAMVANGTNLIAYLNGVQNAIVAHISPATPKLWIGNDADSEFLNGRAAHIKVFNAALTANEILQEMYTILPKKIDALNGWYPTWNGSNRAADYSGLARPWTEGGTLADEDGPPVSYGASSLFFPYTAPAGSSVAIIVTDRAGSRAAAVAIAARVITATDRAGIRAGAALPIARMLAATDRAGTRAGTALPVGRAILSTDILRSSASATISLSHTLALIASARIQLLAQSAVIAGRIIVAVDRAGLRNTATSATVRAVISTDVVKSSSSSVLPALRGIQTTDRAGARAGAALPVVRTIAASDRIISRAGAALPVARAIQATVRIYTRSLSATGAGFLLLYATMRIQSRLGTALPVSRSVITTARISSRAAAALPVSRALSSMAITRSASVAAAIRLVAIAASARNLGMSAALLPVMRNLAATSTILSRGRAAIGLSAPVVILPRRGATYRPVAEHTIYRPTEEQDYTLAAETTIYRPGAEPLYTPSAEVTIYKPEEL